MEGPKRNPKIPNLAHFILFTILYLLCVRDIQIVLCSLSVATEGMQVTLPYTIAVYMVRMFLSKGSAPADEQRVGTLTGLLVSVF